MAHRSASLPLTPFQRELLATLASSPNDDRYLAGAALRRAETFARERPPDESGCLYYSVRLERFVLPEPDVGLEEQGVVLHFGRADGVLPRITDLRILDTPGG